jgi:adenosylmethionine-8-amino-7-oxononanoate aminotransferase
MRAGGGYLDANSSIWTNLHGHNHPALNRAIERQLGKIAHSSALGLANEPAALLAERLVRAAARGLAGPGAPHKGGGAGLTGLRNPGVVSGFLSDDGSTAVEVALKLCYEVARRTRAEREASLFVARRRVSWGHGRGGEPGPH